MKEKEIIDLLKRDGMTENQIKKGITFCRATFKGALSTETSLILMACHRGIPLGPPEKSLKIRTVPPKVEYSKPIFLDKKAFLRFKSKELRKNPSPYEKKFLDLKDNFNQKFIFQYPVIIKDNSDKGYIIDFYFPSVKVAVEIDGYYHSKFFVEDLERDYKLLVYNDIIVIRLKLKETSNIESLIVKINSIIKSEKKQKRIKQKMKASFKLLKRRYLGFNYKFTRKDS